jgi:O-antigen ligase/tetratricopeptide (TPR) repeat protein
MKPSPKHVSVRKKTEHDLRDIVFWASLAVLALVPLAFSAAVQQTFTLPKFAVLLVGAAALAGLLGLMALAQSDGRWRAIRSTHVMIVCFYVGAMAVSTQFGVAPRVALFGSLENMMGLMTRACFLICFLGLIVGIGGARARLQQTLWAITITGLLIALYGFAQFFGRDPFLSADLYTFNSSAGRMMRVIGTLGHADYLGNFLLYTTPVSAAAALATQGRERVLALIATLLSVTVMIFSGTRGAIAGLIVGALVFALMALWRKEPSRVWLNHRTLWRVAATMAIIIAGIVLIAVNPASRNIGARARSVLAEGASGAGRTLQWRDSLPMLSAYALVGCGPEGFRRAFLPYKSKELATLAPQVNSESPHNAYLDAAISYGLPGAVLYVAIIISALALLVRARRHVDDREMKVTFIGILSAFVAVATHNIFIFDQIPTGLYFFAFAALAQAAFNVATAVAPTPASGTERNESLLKPDAAKPPSRWRTGAVAIAGLAVFVAASWYALALLRADAELRRSYAAASAGDFEGALASGRRAANGVDPTGAYQFEMARSLTLFADYAQARLNVMNISKAEADRLMAARAIAINEAMAAAQRSLAHTLTPDSSYMLLAYLAGLAGDQAKLRNYASEALRLDPYFANAHWLMAEAWLMEGDTPEARREAETALEINPYSREARRVFNQTRGDNDVAKQTVEGLREQARDYTSRGKMRKARRRLLRALQQSGGNCLECHRALAQIYEAEERTEKAIAEWQAVAAQASDQAVIEQARSHIEILKPKTAGQ